MRRSPSVGSALATLAVTASLQAVTACAPEPSAPRNPSWFRATISGAVDTTLEGRANYARVFGDMYVLGLENPGEEPRIHLSIDVDAKQLEPGTYPFGVGGPSASYSLGCCGLTVYSMTSSVDGTLVVTEHSGGTLRGTVTYRVVGSVPGGAGPTADTIVVNADFFAVAAGLFQ